MSSQRLVAVCALLALTGCGHEEPPPAAAPPATNTATESASPVPAGPREAPDHANAGVVASEIPCETPGDCAGLTAVCPRPHPHDTGSCLRPYAPTGEHLLGVCTDAHCEVDDDAECQRAAARCLEGGTATFRAYDPPDAEYRRGACTVRCTRFPAPS